ncbi:tetratricopeptide repeat protein [Microscilla marina]|uniref:Serine/threonine protein kinases, putative n=1 Tax=Microscilla marina ATCC 23134 TaxID=313606 RepID=A1ZCF0_MICM2|nr:tetratricopeptide repeat protein [Microscilla marina]EAY31952.1 serine/threonine protein kinases, putative [Microscilla marina ATCC 23134]
MFRVYIIFLFCFFGGHCLYQRVHAQSIAYTDSLKAILQQNLPDTTKILIMNELGKVYARKRPDAALIYIRKALSLAKKKNYSKGLAQAYANQGRVFTAKGDLATALSWYQKALQISQTTQNKEGIALVINNIGIVYSMMGNYKKANDYFHIALSSYEKAGGQTGVAQTLNNIGIVLKQQKQYKQSLEYFERSLSINQQLQNKGEIARCYNNIGLIYKQLKQYTTALEYYQKSLKISQQLNDKRGIAYRWHNMGSIYEKQGKYATASEYFNKSLKLGQELQNRQIISVNLLSLGQASMHTKKQKNALEFAHDALDLANKSGDKKTQKHATGLLAKIYASMKDYQKAYRFHVMFKEKSDSLLNVENIRAIALKESQAKFAKEKEQQANEMARQRQRQYIYIVVILGMLFLLVIIFRSLYTNRKANEKLRQKNEMINLKSHEISVQRDEILKKNELLNKQRNALTTQKTMMLDSIHYAEEIQQSVLPSYEILLSVFEECFVLYKPRDIVSGDFYWIKRLKDRTFFAIADCTGHGIPGALMSMLAISCLNEIVNPETNSDTAYVLNELRNKIKYVLHQVNSEVEHKDGLDIAFCIVEHQTNVLHFSGAYSPLYVLRTKANAAFEINKEVAIESKKYRYTYGQDATLLEIKGDRQPVGVFIREKPFVSYEVALQPGDMFYSFTDGYIDQLGGDEGKKFIAKKLKHLIIKHWQEPMATQQNIFDQALINWQGDNAQVDDILMMGIKPHLKLL